MTRSRQLPPPTHVLVGPSALCAELHGVAGCLHQAATACHPCLRMLAASSHPAALSCSGLTLIQHFWSILCNSRAQSQPRHLDPTPCVRAHKHQSQSLFQRMTLSRSSSPVPSLLLLQQAAPPAERPSSPVPGHPAPSRRTRHSPSSLPFKPSLHKTQSQQPPLPSLQKVQLRDERTLATPLNHFSSPLQHLLSSRSWSLSLRS